MKRKLFNPPRIMLATFFASTLFTSSAIGQELPPGEGTIDSSAMFYDMSLEELLSIQVNTGSLVSLNQFAKPVAVTVITSDDIQLTSSRNMMDLLEVYVPGFFWMDHPSEGPKAGMRGIISDRNLKILLLLYNL